ncbi:hypothetical protein EST92_11830 [Streptomyces sp. TM32]|uniref:hypothetical protein n=1 Tax=Streptomyces sp. TM32 TaxID=1652669 RepID=UPI0010100C97|nr:hypothetical protein [Streptomyces sp. TM32]RXS84240.1 hypothetical protein EST92_11830 [Streptomyces sp. TM32]
MPTTPYVSAAAFRAHPTYLDLDSLRPDNPDPAAQDAVLANLLLQASDWADNEVNQPLGAHLFTQSSRVRTDRSGMIRVHAERGPVSAVTAVGYGSSPTSLTSIASPQAWIEDGANMVIGLGGASGAWTGSLQVGVGAAPGAETFARISYVAGYVSTQLAAAADVGATSLQVADPTGIEPGGQYCIWQPGAEETVTVSPVWQPPAPTGMPAATSVPLAAPTLGSHEAGHDFSGMPPDVRLAIVNYTTALLMRPDTSAEDEFPDTAMASTTRGKDSRRTGVGLVDQARRILSSYQRVR